MLGDTVHTRDAGEMGSQIRYHELNNRSNKLKNTSGDLEGNKVVNKREEGHSLQS